MELIELLRKNHLTVTTVESCTGGLIAKTITDLPGVSDVFDGSIVTYANRIKHALVGVGNTTLNTFGAVSRQTAEEMARGGVERIGADLGISATGIAGPSGGTPQKPVGTVFVGLYFQGTDRVRILELHLAGSREEIRRQTCEIALEEASNFLREELDSKPEFFKE